jgi:histidine ammonia-lyase
MPTVKIAIYGWTLTNWIWGACMPNHLFSISTDAGQEDHVSMGTGVAVRLLETIPRMAEILAIELAYASQAAAIRKEMDHIPSKAPLKKEVEEHIEEEKSLIQKKINDYVKNYGEEIQIDITLKEKYPWSAEDRKLNPVGEAILNDIKKVFPVVKKDRYMAEEIKSLSELVLKGEILKTAEKFLQF